METAELVSIIARLGFGAVATFFAIFLWSSTRDTAWMFVVIGIILRYGEIVYSTFQLFGILQTEQLIFGIPLISILLINLPAVCFTIAFIIAIVRTRMR